MITARARIAALLGLALTAVACREPVGPERAYSRHRAVYAVLEVASANVAVLAETLTELGNREPLRGAQGTVAGDFGAAALTEAAPGPPTCFVIEGPGLALGEDGCYTGTLPQPPGPSDALALDLVLADGSRVRGAVVTPDLPLASIPPDSQSVTVPYTTSPDFYPIAIVPIVLEAAPGARRVDVVATVARGVDWTGSELDLDLVKCRVDATTNPFRAPGLAGTHDMFFYGIACRQGDATVAWSALDLAVHVIAMEENYAGYMNEVLGSSTIDVTRAGFGLEGAVGVFGAVATSVLSLSLTFAPS